MYIPVKKAWPIYKSESVIEGEGGGASLKAINIRRIDLSPSSKMGRSYSPSPPPYSPRSPPYSPTSPAPYSPSSPYYSPSNPPSPLPYDPRAPYPEPMPKYNKYILGNCSGMYYNCKTEDGEVIYGWQVGNFDFIHNILIYENGFTLNGGSLRSFDDPLNHDFLDAIKNSKFPKELVPNDKNTKLHHVSIEVLFSDDPSSQ